MCLHHTDNFVSNFQFVFNLQFLLNLTPLFNRPVLNSFTYFLFINFTFKSFIT